MGPSKRRNSETAGDGRLRTVKRVSMDFIVLVLPVLGAFLRREFALMDIDSVLGLCEMRKILLRAESAGLAMSYE